jgi:NADPH2:quinone reductase
MQAWILPAFTGIESMTLGDLADPVPAADEVVLAVRFAALNPADRYLSDNQYPAKPTFPHVLGRDGIGIVTGVGKDVTGIRIGDTRLILRSDVGVSRPGTLAQQVAVEARYTVPLPPDWSEEQAAAAPLVYLTALQALTQWTDPPLPPQATVLITGASGGVGVASVQLAHALGYRIIALSRSAEKSARLRELGAALTIDPTEKGWRKSLKQQLGDRRVDLIIDSVGGPAFNELPDLLAMHGRISVVGRLAGPVPDFNTATLFFRRLRIGGVAIGSYTCEESHAAWQTVLATLATSGARPLVDHVYPFAEVKAAFDRLQAGPMGKVLVKVD